ncbi:hypothetical protein SAMN00768000_3647 [Sulfobacillus thermosulfidooxidans DSM 9293]|uniref:Uncharacterized protein n=1 Tax=Sulfobacillus thermosulfidooxidans (strain DSM 9293 / VKM B-1269 / AT-1) TaxID=929705 RepID=A0A1W1WPF7_SULTA|nr:hypothetical protein [Sulfobacillus thermosulfidooxidans]SMC08095.1 hypothetical protein SAMN00768000_3647 [Sulfobacillus thermosulfidooxidans DSM 9293]
MTYSAYLSEDDILEWSTWWETLMAYKWTADQGRPVPPLALTWRQGPVSRSDHARRLLTCWIPTAQILTTDDTDETSILRLTWTDPAWTTWLTRLRDPALPPSIRRTAAQTYAQVWATVQDFLAKSQDYAMQATVTAQGRRWTWQWDLDYDNWDEYEPMLVRWVHWLAVLTDLIRPLEEVTWT